MQDGYNEENTQFIYWIWMDEMVWRVGWTPSVKPTQQYPAVSYQS